METSLQSYAFKCCKFTCEYLSSYLNVFFFIMRVPKSFFKSFESNMQSNVNVQLSAVLTFFSLQVKTAKDKPTILRKKSFNSECKLRILSFFPTNLGLK